ELWSAHRARRCLDSGGPPADATASDALPGSVDSHGWGGAVIPVSVSALAGKSVRYVDCGRRRVDGLERAADLEKGPTTHRNRVPTDVLPVTADCSIGGNDRVSHCGNAVTAQRVGTACERGGAIPRSHQRAIVVGDSADAARLRMVAPIHAFVGLFVDDRGDGSRAEPCDTSTARMAGVRKGQSGLVLFQDSAGGDAFLYHRIRHRTLTVPERFTLFLSDCGGSHTTGIYWARGSTPSLPGMDGE